MTLHPLAGKLAPRSMLAHVPRLVTAYYLNHPDPENPTERVAFGTSGHRGSSFKKSFNEDHILAIVQSICDYRQELPFYGRTERCGPPIKMDSF